MKKFCECFKKHARRIINFGKQKLKLLRRKHQKSYGKAKFCYISRETFEDKYPKDEKYRKVKDNFFFEIISLRLVMF